MNEKVLNEQVDKYRCEFSAGTTGGRVGFSVRAVGENKEVVLAEAKTMAWEAMASSNEMTEQIKK